MKHRNKPKAVTSLRKVVERDPLVNVVNFENLIYMKLYSLLILTENTKKSKNNFKAQKKSKIVVLPGRILPCKQNKHSPLIGVS